jgi:GDPmannose 4,6-dehydratase
LSLAKSRAPWRESRGLEDELVLGNRKIGATEAAPSYVLAMWLVLQHEKPDDFVVATGETPRCASLSKPPSRSLSCRGKYVKHNRAFDRLNDPAHLVGSAEKIKATLSWQPTGSFIELVREMVDAELTDASIRIMKISFPKTPASSIG